MLQDYGNLKGDIISPMNWNAVNCSSRVFVSISEFDMNGCGFIGAARYPVDNVEVRNGGIDVWITIECTPIRIHTDFLAVNP
jgi:hypothetical protein